MIILISFFQIHVISEFLCFFFFFPLLQVSDVGSEKLFSPTAPKGKSLVRFLLRFIHKQSKICALFFFLSIIANEPTALSGSLILQLPFRFKCRQT